MKHVNEKSFLNLRSGRVEQWQTSRVESMELAPYGRWILGICTIASLTALGKLCVCVLTLKQALRTVSEGAMKANICEWVTAARKT